MNIWVDLRPGGNTVGLSVDLEDRPPGSWPVPGDGWSDGTERTPPMRLEVRFTPADHPRVPPRLPGAAGYEPPAATEIHVWAQVLDGWLLDATFVPGDDGPTLRQVSLVATEAEAPALGSRVLRHLGFAAVADEFAAWLKEPRVVAILSERWGRRPARPGRAGTDDLVYAEAARRYVDALARDRRRPVKLLIDEAAAAGRHMTAAELRAMHLRARQRGLLSAAPPGQPGGQLTARATALLADADRIKDEVAAITAAESRRRRS
ncbi:MAG: hypothetical protein ACRD0U_19190 [Acidimicrobiales bacterium]